jgi:hypothetical protein
MTQENEIRYDGKAIAFVSRTERALCDEWLRRAVYRAASQGRATVLPEDVEDVQAKLLADVFEGRLKLDQSRSSRWWKLFRTQERRP